MHRWGEGGVGGSGQAPTLGSAFATGANSFDLMRLVAAIMVLASHAFVLAGHPDDEPVARLLGHVADGGGLAVAMFFVLSGFLIARSAERGRPTDYARARCLRIYPAFLAVIFLQALVLGPAASALPVMAYLSGPAAWIAIARSLVFSPPAGLPGVFEANPVPLVVNGSLWTLRIEVLCYVGALLLSVTGLLRRGWVLLPLGAGFGLLGATMAAGAGLLPPVFATLKVVSIVDCVLHFLMGATLWSYRDAVPCRGWLAAAGVLAFAVSIPTPMAPLVLHVVLPYVVLWLGLARPLGQALLRRTGDVSYGAYLYAFPIQQTVVAWLGPEIGPLGLIAVSLPPALLCASLSRRFIEAPALLFRPPRNRG